MAIGNEEIEDTISAMPGVGRAENVEEIDLIEEILQYDSYDFIVMNTLLSERKAVRLADYVENILDSPVKPKIIALVKNLNDKKLIAQLVGFGVTAFVSFDELGLIGRYMENYPASFDLGILSEEHIKTDITATRVINGTISIGVFNLDSGAGATTCSLKLAEDIANCGYRVICMEFGQENFCSIKKKPKTLELVSADLKEKDTILQLAFSDNSFQFIILDFGKLFNVSTSGELISTKHELIGDFLRCNYKLGMCYASLWHNGKMDIFLKNDSFRGDLYNEQLFLLASGDEKSEAELIEDYHELPIYRRNEMKEFTEIFKRRIGISRINKRKDKKIQLFRRK